MMRTTRRETLAAAALLVPLLGASRIARAAAGSGGRLSLVDPAIADARSTVEHWSGGWQPIAIEGDRVRLARDVLARSPERVAGLSTWSDFLLLSGSIEEEGYRLTSVPLLEQGRVSWLLERRGL